MKPLTQQLVQDFAEACDAGANISLGGGAEAEAHLVVWPGSRRVFGVAELAWNIEDVFPKAFLEKPGMGARL